MKQGYELQASCGSEPLPSQMKIPGESKGSRSTRETTQANVQDPLLFYTRIKKNETRRGKGGSHMSKSQVQQNASETEKKRKQLKRETWNCIPTHLKHSSDGKYYFGWWPFCQRERESRRERDEEEEVHVPYYTVVIGENCNHLWLTWNTLRTVKDIIFL